MINDRPTACDMGMKRHAKGHAVTWQGDKLHSDAADGDIPIRCLLSAASLHDRQAAIPLAQMSTSRVSSCDERMDAA